MQVTLILKDDKGNVIKRWPCHHSQVEWATEQALRNQPASYTVEQERNE